MKKTTSGFDVIVDGATVDLFGIKLTKCPNCSGEGEIDETPEGVSSYEIFEDCDICNGTGEI